MNEALDMSTFAVIGAGRLGGALGRALLRLGHRVTFQVPQPDDSKYAALRALPGATVSALGPVPAEAEMIFLATPWDAALDAVSALGDLSGRVLVDCMNPVTYGLAGMALAIDANTSAAEMIAAKAPGALVAKCFNQVGSPVIDAVTALKPAPMMGVACDDPATRAQVMALAKGVGFDSFDAGGLANARLLEAFALLWMGQAFASGDPAGFAFGRSARSSGRGQT
jgi:predicted dinucleotide-binding enzyme